jgi:hypothetical protein
LQGTEITRFPAGGYLVTQVFQDPKLNRYRDVGVIGMIELENFRISVMGDSSCLDLFVTSSDCLWLLRVLLDFASTSEMELDENFRLPYDYDIHIEEEQVNSFFNIPEISLNRSRDLQCVKRYSGTVARFEPEQHEHSNKKLRIWAPLREPEPFDLVGIVQVGTFLIVVLLFGILFFNRYKLKNSARLRSII